MLHRHAPHRLLSDERLAVLARAGDADAFALLYARHEKALLGYCRSITRDAEDARDALQTAMVRAYAGFAAKPAGAPARAWLFRIAHNESVNVLRRRRPELRLMDADLSSASAADESASRVAARELLAEVARLPVRQRGALVLRELQGLDYGEIAAALSVTEGNARQLVFAARNGLEESRAGRRLPCELVRDVIEVGDRRAQRRRGMRAHLHICRDCREYARAAAPQRRRAAFVLPGWLAGWGGFAQSAGTGGAGVVASAGEMGSMAVKGVAVVAVAAAAAGAAAQHAERPATRHHAAVVAKAPARKAAKAPAVTATSALASSHVTVSASHATPAAGGPARTAPAVMHTPVRAERRVIRGERRIQHVQPVDSRGGMHRRPLGDRRPRGAGDPRMGWDGHSGDGARDGSSGPYPPAGSDPAGTDPASSPYGGGDQPLRMRTGDQRIAARAGGDLCAAAGGGGQTAGADAGTGIDPAPTATPA